MAGVAHKDRIRSQDPTAIMRRIGALEDGLFSMYSDLSSSLTASAELRAAASDGFYVTRGTDIEVYNSSGSLTGANTFPGGFDVTDIFYVARGSSRMYVFGQIGEVPNEYMLRDYSFSLSSRSDVDEPDDIGTFGTFGNGKIFHAVGGETTVYVIDPSDASTISSWTAAAVGGITANNDWVYVLTSGTIRKYSHSGSLDTSWSVSGATSVLDIDVKHRRVHALWADDPDSNTLDWHITAYSENGTQIFTTEFDTDVSSDSPEVNYRNVAVDDAYNVFLGKFSVGNPVNIYSLVPVLRDQTEFFKYPTTTFAARVSLGTPDGGASIPALTAFEPDATYPGGIVQRGNELFDMQSAIQDLAPFYLNILTGDAFNWDGASANNLYNVAVESGKYDWDEDGSQGDRMREDMIDEMDLCAAKLEDSDRL